MTRDQAICKALSFVKENRLEIGPMKDVRFLDLDYLDGKANQCPPELMETFNSVRKNFRNHWVVSFGIIEATGQTSCPSSRSVSVFDDGEVTLT
jgi:hypothetical protein